MSSLSTSVNGVALYSSGFIGSQLTSSSVEKPTTRVNSVGNTALIISTSDKYPVANTLFDEVEKTLSNVFAFNEAFADVYMSFLEGFVSTVGTTNFVEWLGLQELSPNFTRTHRDFLADTLNYLLTGKRALPVSLWVDVFDHTPRETSTQPFKIDPELIRAFVRSFGHKVSDMIVRWQSIEGGVADMIASSRLLYGSSLIK